MTAAASTAASFGRRWLVVVTPAVAIALILYLPIEGAVLALVPERLYWPLRLLPDMTIAVLAAATMLVDGRRPLLATRVLWIVAAIALVVVLLNAARDVSMITSVNALRVLLRFLVMGVLLWRWLPGSWAGPRAFGVALLAAGLVQVALGLAIGLPNWLAAFATSAAFAPVSGTMGRYDRYGLFMAALAFLILAHAGRRLSLRHITLLALVLICLALSTSRQAQLGLAAGALVVMVVPAMRAPTRVVAFACVIAACAMILVAPTRIAQPAGAAEVPPPEIGQDSGSDGSTEPLPTVLAPPAATSKGSTRFSIDPNQNFRLYLNLALAPWSVTQQPLLGFGPGSHVDPDPNRPLATHVQGAGIAWSYALPFMNDSNYATLVIQFGLALAALFVLVVAATVASAGRDAHRSGRPAAVFALGYGIAVVIAAGFGPAFEIRTVSALLWIGLAVAVFASRQPNAHGAA